MPAAVVVHESRKVTDHPRRPTPSHRGCALALSRVKSAQSALGAD